MVRLIDSTPIPLGKLCDWAKSNGRIRGMKMHVVYDPEADCPTHPRHHRCQRQRRSRSAARSPSRPAAPMSSTRAIAITAGGAAIDRPAPVFVTRPKTNMASSWCATPRQGRQGDGFTVLEDTEVSLASKGDSKLPIRLRRLRRPAPRGRHHHAADQRPRALRRRHRRPLQGALANRAAVPLDQAASQDPQVPRQQRQCDPPAALRRDDRLCAAAHRRPPPAASPSRSCASPIWSPCASSNAAASTPSTSPRPSTQADHDAELAQSDRLRLCLTFPGQPCVNGGGARRAGGGRPQSKIPTNFRSSHFISHSCSPPPASPV